jgi:DNA-binding response OmpR family regulator
MAGERKPLRIAIFNDSRSVLNTLKTWFEIQGHTATAVALAETRDPDVDMPKLAQDFSADVIVFDVGIPLQATYDMAAATRLAGPLKNTPMVLTTRNVAVLNEAIGSETGAFELTGTAENLVELLKIVEKNAAPLAWSDEER